MKLKINDDTLVLSIYLLSCMMIVGQITGVPMVTSVAYALSFGAVLLIWGLHVKETTIIDVLALIIVYLALLCAVITCKTFSASYIKNWIIFSVVFLYLSTCMKIKLKTETIEALFRINFVICIACVCTYVLNYKNVFYVTRSGMKYLVFGFYNPNALALFLVAIALIMIIYYSAFSPKFAFLKKICCILGFGFMILQTRSRTALLAYLVFAIVSVIFVKRKTFYLPQNNMFYLGVSGFPLFFAITYMIGLDLVKYNKILALLISEGKGLDSRQYVWNYAFNLFKKSPIWGSYGYVATSAEFAQMHNSHINVLVSYGIIVLVLVIVFLYVILKKSALRAKGRMQRVAVWAFIVCLVLGSGEAILFSGGLSFYLLVGQFLLISNAEMNTEKV